MNEMKDKVTLRSGSRLHILVPWNSISRPDALRELFKPGDRTQNALAVFLPINRG